MVTSLCELRKVGRPLGRIYFRAIDPLCLQRAKIGIASKIHSLVCGKATQKCSTRAGDVLSAVQFDVIIGVVAVLSEGGRAVTSVWEGGPVGCGGTLCCVCSLLPVHDKACGLWSFGIMISSANCGRCSSPVILNVVEEGETRLGRDTPFDDHICSRPVYCLMDSLLARSPPLPSRDICRARKSVSC